MTQHEIASQPALWRRALREAPALAEELAAPGEPMLIIGCGTSAFMAQAIATLREEAGLGETDWAYASELPTAGRYARVVALTRSGTTSEVLDALRAVAPPTRRVVITAVAGMPVADLADATLVIDWADEESVVQTRFPTTILVLARAAFGAQLDHLPQQCEDLLEAPPAADPTAYDHSVALGRGWSIGLAHESALKLREAAQAWAESYPALDYRHGPIAVAGPRTLVWSHSPLPAGLRADIEGVGATVIEASGDPLLSLVATQRFAVDLAAVRGLDPDHPRNLTRSVILG